MTAIDPAERVPGRMREALAALESEPVRPIEKGIPAGFTGSIRDIGRQGWRVLAGDVPLPSLILRESAVVHNLAAISDYCTAHDAWLAPHGKTTMAPQLFARQLAAGAWAITVANISQLQVCRAFSVPRVLLANEVVDSFGLSYLASELKRDAEFELLLLVDSPSGVSRLAGALRDAGVDRPVEVLVEIGMPGGRCGVRTVEEAREVVGAVRKHASLRFAGIEGFEGAAHGTDDEDQLRRVDDYAKRLVLMANELMRAAKSGDNPFIVSAGGTAFADRIVRSMENLRESDGAKVVLRLGCYITHDSGYYDRHSAFGARSTRRTDEPVLDPAIEVWSAVLSRPEPELCILGAGKRDLPTDEGLPVPLLRSTGGDEPVALGPGYEIAGIMDQHCYLRVPQSSDLAVGDLVGCGISHPCAAFDRWRLALLVDGERHVTGAIRTFF